MLGYLLRRTLRSIAVVASICVAVALAASSVRLLPWIASDAVPIRVSMVFAQALALAALEVALVVAPALGVALELARCNSEGTTTALFCTGAGPARQLLPIGLAAGLAALSCLAVSSTWGGRASRPGLLTNDLIEAARPSCPHDRPSQSPLLGVAWLCLDRTPVLAGSWGAPSHGAWTASQMRLSHDLHSVSLQNVTASSRRPAVHAQFGHVLVSGLVPWTMASTLPGLARGLAFALAAIGSALAAGWGVLRYPTASAAVAMFVGAVGPLVFLTAAPALFERGWLVAIAGSALLPAAAPALACAVRGRLRLLMMRRGGTYT